MAREKLVAERKVRLERLAHHPAHPMVGVFNSAPARMPVGQREASAICM
jgi:hypothetical protein